MIAGFTQTAHGQFTAYLQPNSPHCGPDQSHTPISRRFAFKVQIIWSAEALDEQGFLLDNTWFHSYFASLEHARISISCEKPAILACEDICRECGPRLCHCESVSVEIEGIPGVTVAAKANPQHAVPLRSMDNIRQDLYAGVSVR